MKLQFLKLKIENFKSFKSEVLNLKQFGSGLHFMCGQNYVDEELGSNGAGKSTVWDALFWCLYGKTTRNLRNPAIRPWVGKDTTKVSLWIRVNSSTYIVIRTASPNRLVLKPKGNPKKDIDQDHVEKLIGLSPEVFGHAVLMGQFSDLFFDLRPAEKMTLFSEILNLERWLQAADVASKRCERIRGILEQISSDISFLDGAMTSLRERYRGIRREEGDWTNEREERLAELKKLQSRRTKEIGDLEVKYKRLNSRLLSRHDKLLKLSSRSSLTSGTLNNLNHDLDIVQLEQDKLEGLIDGAKVMLSTKKGVCPVCKQPWISKKAVAHRKKLRADLVKWKKQYQENKKRKHAVVLKIKKTTNDSLRIEKKLQQQADNNGELKNKETALFEELQKHRTKLQAEKEVLVIIRRGKNPHADQVKEIRADIKTKKEELVELKKKQRLKIRTLERTQFWVKAFKEVRLYLMEQTLKHLEIVTNSILPELGLEKWNIYYEVERETKSGGISRGFNVVITSPNLKKGPVPWESWSGGEGQRLRLAGSFALSEILLDQAGVTPDMEVLDEPTQRLSSEGIRDLCTMLKDRAKRLDRATWYIDHQSIEQVGFSSVVRIEKDGTGSHVRY